MLPSIFEGVESATMKILVVEDDPELAEAVADELRDELYAVDVAMDGATASELVAVNDYDTVVLDDGIPPPTGSELLAQWRSEGNPVPVLMLTARSSLEEKVAGLDLGADDYLTKPFEFDELLARVRSLLRRRSKPLPPPLEAGDLSLDRASRILRVGADDVELTAKEFSILEFLLRRRGEVVARGEILEHSWESDYDPMTNVVEVYIHRLRGKIEKRSGRRLIQTVRGVGYRFVG